MLKKCTYEQILYGGLLLGAILWGVIFLLNSSGVQTAIFYHNGKDLYSDFYMIQDFLREADYYRPFSHPWHDSNYVALVRLYFSAYPYSLTGAVFFTIVSSACYLLSIGLFSKARKLPVIWTLVGVVSSSNFISAQERGNSIIVSAAAVVLFLAWFDSKVRWQRMVAAVALAFAGVSKVSPALLGFLYFKKWQWREMIVCAVAAFLFFFVPFFIPGYGGVDGILQWYQNAKANSEHYALFGAYGFTRIFYGIHDVLVSLGHGGEAKGVVAVRPLSPMFGLCVFVGSFLAAKTYVRVLLTLAALLIIPGNQHSYCGLYLVPVMFWVAHSENKTWLSILVVLMFWAFVAPVPLIAAVMSMVQNLALMGLSCYFVIRTVMEKCALRRSDNGN